MAHRLWIENVILQLELMNAMYSGRYYTFHSSCGPAWIFHNLINYALIWMNNDQPLMLTSLQTDNIFLERTCDDFWAVKSLLLVLGTSQFLGMIPSVLSAPLATYEDKWGNLTWIAQKLMSTISVYAKKWWSKNTSRTHQHSYLNAPFCSSSPSRQLEIFSRTSSQLNSLRLMGIQHLTRTQN